LKEEEMSNTSKITQLLISQDGSCPHRGDITLETRKNNPLISKASGYDESTQHFFVKDADHPYIQEKPFDWIRGYQVGGKSLTWGRACARWSPFDFTAPNVMVMVNHFP
jgi:choline dehydrogenase-like flavoprotein